MRSEQMNELGKALAAAQARIRGAVKDSDNLYFESKYADLTSVWDACRDALTANGLSVVQTTDIQDGRTVLITTLLHSSGQWISGTMPILAAKPDSQAMGSAITYARRYALQMIAGVSAEDDDGESAVGRERAPAPRPEPVQKKSSLPEAPPTEAPLKDEKGNPVTDFGQAMISFGKYANKRIKDVSISDLQSYRAYLVKSASHLNKPLQGPAKQFIADVDAYEKQYYARSQVAMSLPQGEAKDDTFGKIPF